MEIDRLVKTMIDSPEAVYEENREGTAIYEFSRIVCNLLMTILAIRVYRENIQENSIANDTMLQQHEFLADELCAVMKDDETLKLALDYIEFKHILFALSGKKNKGVIDEYILDTKSPYLFVERLFFMKWSKFEGHEWTENNISSLYSEFSMSSWYGGIKNYIKLDELDTNDFADYIEDVVESDFLIKNEKSKGILWMLLVAFSHILKTLYLKHEYIVEDDEREHICGLCFPRELTYEDFRIEIAFDYLVKNNHLSKDVKNLFRKIMKGDAKDSDKVRFMHGKNANGSIKKNGGNSVLYWIIRYILEPVSFFEDDAKSASYQEYAKHFYFTSPENTCNYTKLSDAGKGSINVANHLRTIFKEIEKENHIDITK